MKVFFTVLFGGVLNEKFCFSVILSRIMYLVAPSTRSSHSQPRLSIRLTSRTRKMAKSYNGQDVNGGFNGNLSSTLEKLYAWEKKLYKEVKVLIFLIFDAALCF